MRTNAATSKSAPGVSPQIGAAAAPVFRPIPAGLRVFSNHRPALAGLTKSAPPGDDFETPAGEAVHPPRLTHPGEINRRDSVPMVFPTGRRWPAFSTPVTASGGGKEAAGRPFAPYANPSFRKVPPGSVSKYISVRADG